jgi:hypothetical protein
MLAKDSRILLDDIRSVRWRAKVGWRGSPNVQRSIIVAF